MYETDKQGETSVLTKLTNQHVAFVTLEEGVARCGEKNN